MPWFLTPHGPHFVVEPGTIDEYERRDYPVMTQQQVTDYYAGVVTPDPPSFATEAEVPGIVASAVQAGTGPMAEALRAALGSSFRRLRSRKVWAIGDSLTAGTGSGGGGLTYDNTLYAGIGQGAIWYQPGAWETWAMLASNARWTIAGVFATGGYTAAQILSTHVPTVIAAASPGDTVVVLAGTNNNVLADVKTIHTTLRNAGLNTVACTLPPSTAAGVSAVAAFNEGIRDFAFANDIPLCDVHATLVDLTTGAFQTALNGDGVHPNQDGYKVMGQTIAATLAQVFSGQPMTLVDTNATITGSSQSNPLALTAPVNGTDYSLLSALGTSTIAAGAVSGFTGGQGYVFTRGDTDINARLKLCTLVPGHRLRIGMALAATVTSGTVGMRLESNTTGQKIPWGLGYGSQLGRSVAAGRFYSEFVVPPLPDTSYRLRVNLSGAGTVLSLGEITIFDLTAMGVS